MNQQPVWSNDRQWWWDGVQWRRASEFPGSPARGAATKAAPQLMLLIAGGVGLLILMGVCAGIVAMQPYRGPFGPSPQPGTAVVVVDISGGSESDQNSHLFYINDRPHTVLYEATAGSTAGQEGIVICEFNITIVNPRTEAAGSGEAYTTIVNEQHSAPFNLRGEHPNIVLPPGQYVVHVGPNQCIAHWAVRVIRD